MPGGGFFIDGCSSNHSTAERTRGSRMGHHDLGSPNEEHRILACDYAPEKAAQVFSGMTAKESNVPRGVFVNSTILLEDVMHWIESSPLSDGVPPTIDCFGWNPFVALLGHDIEPARQDVPGRVTAVFEIIEMGNGSGQRLIGIPPILA